jgi:DOPA 4,5-dioxygenase
MKNVSFYHVHTYFDAASRASAVTLREKLREEFAGRARVHGLIDEPIGPHPLPMFETDIPASEMEAVKAWLEKNHGAHSILIHPLTGDDVADHRDHPQWVGPPLPLDIEFLKNYRR